jgi:hypothetical protein
MTNDARIFRHGPPGSVLDRLAGSLLAGLFVGITLILLPLVVASFSFTARITILRNAESAAIPFAVWCVALSACAMIMGLQLGSGRTIELLGHLWGTYEPKNRVLTSRLWAGIAISACITFAIAFPWARLIRVFA